MHNDSFQMKIHHLSIDEAYQSLQSTPGALETGQVAQRLEEYGPNNGVQS